MTQPTDHDNTYKASWLELFFDLVFVALIAQLTYNFSHHHKSILDFLNVGLVGYMVFFAWWGTVVSRNLKQREDIVDTIAIQFQMLLVMVMSLTLSEGFDKYSWLFFGSFALNGFVALALIRRMYHLNPSSRPNTLNIWWGFFISNCLWLTAGFFSDFYLYLFAFCALTLQIFTPMSKGKGNRVILMNMHHLLERMGLLLLVVMGEAVLVVALTNTAAPKFDLDRLIIVMSGLVQMIALWWLYFPYTERCVAGQRARNFQLMFHGHAFLYGSLVLIATGLKILLNSPSSGLPEMAIYLAGTALLMISFNTIQASINRSIFKSFLSVFAFTSALLAAAWAFNYLKWDATQMVPIVALLMVVYVLLDRRHHAKKHPHH